MRSSNGSAGGEIVDFLGGMLDVTVHDGSGCWIGFRRSKLGVPEQRAMRPGGAGHVGVILKLGVQVADVFPVAGAGAADGIDAELAVAAVGVEGFYEAVGPGSESARGDQCFAGRVVEF